MFDVSLVGGGYSPPKQPSRDDQSPRVAVERRRLDSHSRRGRRVEPDACRRFKNDIDDIGEELQRPRGDAGSARRLARGVHRNET